jgi:hypothetical protein
VSRKWFPAVVALVLGPAFWFHLRAEDTVPEKTTLRFEVAVAKGLLDKPADGRVLLVLARRDRPEPRRTIGQTGMEVPPLLGQDANGFGPGATTVVDQSSAIFPIADLSRLPKGDYFVQAVFDVSRDLKLPDAPGNLYSEVQKVAMDPARGGTVKVELTHRVPDEQTPAETELVKFVKIRSELLSKFHGRPMYLRAGIILPRDFEKDKDRRYPLWVRIGGYGSRYTTVAGMASGASGFRRTWLADDAPRMVMLFPDGAGPYGDPYQVNSANNGPYGDALTKELIPYVEKKFRCVGEPYARVLDGHSTGGWVSLALQVFYPDFFNGTWSHAPDPVDFRSYELIDIYEDANAYVNRLGFERPACRDVDGETRYTVRHECQLEVVLGRGDRWWLSGKDWCAWNAVFGPRGEDGLPKPLWDGKSGKIDRSVVEHWKQYDLRLVLEKNWPTLGPKLRGKIHVWVGEGDDYFLNNAVHRLDAFLSRAKPAYEGKITFGMRRDHGWRGLTERELIDEMAKAVTNERPK